MTESASRLRIAVSPEAPPIPLEQATEQAQWQFRTARDAYINVLQVFGGHRLRWLLRSEEKVTVRALRAARDEAQRMAELALAVVGALDACIDTCARAAKQPRGQQ